MPFPAYQQGAGLSDPLHQGLALAGTHGLTQRRPGFLFPQSRFDPIQELDLFDYPVRGPGGVFDGVVELATHMRPAIGQLDLLARTLRQPINLQLRR